jgi:thymidylate kinase
MIIGIEGLSKSGKTTFINKFIEKYPNTIRFRGAGSVNIGIQSRWQEYNFWMHNIIEQLDKLNDHKLTIMWDRFMTDSVHSEDSNYRSEILRSMKSHKKKLVIFIDVPVDVLKHRGTKEGNLINDRRSKYLDTIQGFEHLIITPDASNDYKIEDYHIEEAINFIAKHDKNNNFRDPY